MKSNLELSPAPLRFSKSKHQKLEEFKLRRRVPPYDVAAAWDSTAGPFNSRWTLLLSKLEDSVEDWKTWESIPDKSCQSIGLPPKFNVNFEMFDWDYNSTETDFQ